MPFVKETFNLKQKTKLFLFLMDTFSLSQSEAQKIIDKGRILRKGMPLKDKSVEISGEIEVIYFKPISKNLLPIYENEFFAIYDKPSGLMVHPNSRNTPYTLTDEVKFRYGKDANIIHRLDKETSGLIVVGKNKRSEIELKNLFQKRAFKKRYLAYVEGFINESIIIDQPIKVNNLRGELKQKMIISSDGKPSVSIVKPIRYYCNKDTTLVEIETKTGRQHQIRVHLFYIGHRIIGDPLYGVNFEIATKYLDNQLSENEKIMLLGATRLMLHAYKLSFIYKDKQYDFISKENFEI